MLTLRTELFPGEPIVVFHYQGVLVPDIVDRTAHAVSEIWNPEWSHAVFIYSTDELQVNFAQVMGMVRNMSFENPYVKMEAELKIILVGSAPLLRFFANVAQKNEFGKNSFPLSLSVDNALEVGRIWLREKVTTS